LLEIVQAKDFGEYQNLFEELKIADKIVSVVEALDKNAVIGFGIYYFKAEEVIICHIDSRNDKFLYDGIVRSILYLAQMNKINKAEFKIKDNEILAELGFVNNDKNCLENIEDFMDKCKNCKIHN